MELVVDLAKVTVVLQDPDNLAQLVVRVGAPPDASAAQEATVHRLADVLAAANVGALEASGTAVVRADALRFHAAGQVDPDWDERFTAMCRGAVMPGGAGPDGGTLRATVVWPSGDATG